MQQTIKAKVNNVVTSPPAGSHGFPWGGSCGTPAAPTDTTRPKAEDAGHESQNKHCGGVTNCLLPPAVNHGFPWGGSSGISIAVLSACRRLYSTTQVSQLCPTRTAACVPCSQFHPGCCGQFREDTGCSVPLIKHSNVLKYLYF